MSDFIASLASIEWLYSLGYIPLEVIATLAGVLSLILLAKENILAWPIGIVWSVISCYLAFFNWQLVSDAILYFLYIPLQLYCWMIWARNDGQTQPDMFTPRWLSSKAQLLLIITTILCIALWATGVSLLAGKISWILEPAMLIRDSATTVLNFIAQFLMAKKRMENWVLWLVVNVLTMHIYYVQESPIYVIQYALFLVLGIYGWYQWQQHRNRLSCQ